MAEIERVFHIGLSPVYNKSIRRRTRYAVSFLRQFLVRHMRASEDQIKISAELNDFLWSHGMGKPPRHLSIRAKKDSEGIVVATLLEVKKPEAAKPKEKEKKAGPPEKPKEEKKAEAKKAEKPEEKKPEQKKTEEKIVAKPRVRAEGEEKHEEKKHDARPEPKHEAKHAAKESHTEKGQKKK